MDKDDSQLKTAPSGDQPPPRPPHGTAVGSGPDDDDPKKKRIHEVVRIDLPPLPSASTAIKFPADLASPARATETKKWRPLSTLGILSAIFLFGVLLLLVCDWAFAPPEPEFHGRTISAWLGNYPQLKQRDWREAEAAMHAFGTNNIPFILDSFTENDSFWRRWRNRIWFSGPPWLAKIVGRSPPRLDTTYAPEIFEAIGPSCIPALTNALKDRSPTRQMAAARALAYFGILSKGSLPQMCQCLSNAPPNSKSWTAINNSIAEIESSLKRYRNQATNALPAQGGNVP